MWLRSDSAGKLPEATRHFHQDAQIDALYARDAPTLSH